MSRDSERFAVIYARVSSIRQTVDGSGLDTQETRSREFARSKNYKVEAVFQDDVSGSLIDRPGMKDMLAHLRKHRARGTVVIIDDISRLARGLHAHLELRSAIAKAGGFLESPSIEFGEDSDSQLVEHLLASVSQHARMKNADQTRARMKARIQNGYHAFAKPMGYKWLRVSGRGMMLTPDEPIASVLREALEGFAAGRLETQADVRRFLLDHPLFPKSAAGNLAHSRIGQILRQCAYAGCVEAPKWGVSMRKGHHQAIISLDTYQRIQDRLSGNTRTPKRGNLNEDFPLRGFVTCSDCNSPLTACWAKGEYKRYAYYHCVQRDCPSRSKSIRREKIEGEFVELLRQLRPSPALFTVAREMLESLWAQRAAIAAAQAKALKSDFQKVEAQIAKLLERIIDATVPSVVNAYEQRIAKLESEKLLIQERMTTHGRPVSTFEATFRTALWFLSNPCKIWDSGSLQARRTVLKLAFVDRLTYSRNEGFRTANLALPFKVLGLFPGGEGEMARPERFERPTLRFVV